MTNHLTWSGSFFVAGDNEPLSFDEDLRQQSKCPDEQVIEGSVEQFDAALACFRAGGKTPDAQAMMDAALAANFNVPIFLLELLDINEPLWNRYPDADFQRALRYVRERRKVWEETPGALAWLMQCSVLVQVE